MQFWLAHVQLEGRQPRQRREDGASLCEPQRKTLWGLQVGGRRLTSDLKLLTALHTGELAGLGDSTVLHVEPSLVFAIDNSDALPHDHCDAARTAGALPGAIDVEEALDIPLGALVSFDLDANLQYRLEVSMHKMQIAGCARAITLSCVMRASMCSHSAWVGRPRRSTDKGLGHEAPAAHKHRVNIAHIWRHIFTAWCGEGQHRRGWAHWIERILDGRCRGAGCQPSEQPLGDS